MDVFGLGGKIPGGVQREEPGVLDRAHGLQQARLIEGAVEFVKQTEQMVRRDRIQRLADVIVRGDAPDLEQRASIVLPLDLFHVLLKAQERGALGEEDRERRQGDIRHRELCVVARAPVRETGDDAPPTFDELIEATRIHASRNAGTGSKVQVTIV